MAVSAPCHWGADHRFTVEFLPEFPFEPSPVGFRRRDATSREGPERRPIWSAFANEQDASVPEDEGFRTAAVTRNHPGRFQLGPVIIGGVGTHPDVIQWNEQVKT